MLLINFNLINLLTGARERGGRPAPWSISFDHTHRKKKGKGAYTDKKVVAELFLLVVLINIQV